MSEQPPPSKPEKLSRADFRFHEYENRKSMSFLGVNIPYPRKGVELLALVAVLSVVGLLFVRLTDREFLDSAKKHLFSTIEVTPDGSVHQISGFVRYGFWTPGEHTATRDIVSTGTTSPQTRELEDWEKTVTEAKLIAFGDRLLKELGSNGYRRYEVAGHGRTRFKHGWWWIVALPEYVTPAQFAQFYRNEFKSTKSVYLETIGNAQ